MINSEVEAASAPMTVRLGGPLNLQTIGAAHRALVEALDGGGDVVLAMDPDPAVDLTLAQLIISARRSLQAAGAALTLAEPARGGLLDLLRRGGFLETAENRAFWLKQNEEAA